MPEKSSKTIQQKTKMNLQIPKTPQFYFGVAAVLFLSLGLLLAFPKYGEYRQLKADLQKINQAINGNNAQGDFLGLEGQKKKWTNEYNETKSTLDKLNAEKQAILDFVFPDDEKINFLTNLLERYAIDHDSVQNTFQLNSISFSKKQSVTKQVLKTGEKPQAASPFAYEIIQINLPIQSSEKNFKKFIEFIQNSGSLDPKNFYGGEIAVPLMTIETLNFSYADSEKSDQRIVNANFILNTYIRLSSKNVSTTK